MLSHSYRWLVKSRDFLADAAGYLFLRLLQHRIHIVAQRMMIEPGHPRDLKAGVFGKGLQRFRCEVVHMVGPTETAPAGTTQVTAHAVEVRHFDGDAAAWTETFEAAPQRGGWIGFVL